MTMVVLLCRVPGRAGVAVPYRASPRARRQGRGHACGGGARANLRRPPVVRAPSPGAGVDRHARGMVTRGARVVLPGLPREVAGILRRHWWVATLPAAALGAGADALVLLRHELGGEIAVGIALALAFELYVGWAELIVAADRSEGERPGVLTILRRAGVVTPPLLLASIVAVTLPLAAASLLVVPGLWLLTRWSLFAPAVVHEGLGPRTALRRSADLVHGAFWVVAATVTASVLIEHGVIHATAHAAEPALG